MRAPQRKDPLRRISFSVYIFVRAIVLPARITDIPIAIPINTEAMTSVGKYAYSAAVSQRGDAGHNKIHDAASQCVMQPM